MTAADVDEMVYLGDPPAAPDVDSVVFDCDGVLVDVARSYGAAIRGTVRHALERHAGIADGMPVDQAVIEGFKSTGGFNDEVDLAYAAVLSIAAARRLGRDQRRFVLDVIAHCDSTGIASAEAYVRGLADVADVADGMAYPGTGAESPLRRTFDQMFYGQRLYRRLYGRDSEFPGPGLIENDVVLAGGGLLDSLRGRFGTNVALVTGRGRESARHSLGGLLDWFDLENSFFLEDEPREMAKPNPEPLIRSMRGMGSSRCLYVGDSMEDLLMAGEAARLGADAAFCGITGTSSSPGEKLEMFRRGGARMALASVNLLPKALNLE